MDRTFQAFFSWALVSFMYYVVKNGLQYLRTAYGLDTWKGKVFVYCVCILGIMAFVSVSRISLQNRISLFVIMVVPAIIGAYYGFKDEKPAPPIEKENYVTAANRKVKEYGAVIADSPNPTCIPISKLPYPVSEIKEAIQRMYLYSTKEPEYRTNLFMGYVQLSDFIPDDKAEIMRLWLQRTPGELSSDNASLGEEAVHIMGEMQIQYGLLWDEWVKWLQTVEPETTPPEKARPQ